MINEGNPIATVREGGDETCMSYAIQWRENATGTEKGRGAVVILTEGSEPTGGRVERGGGGGWWAHTPTGGRIEGRSPQRGGQRMEGAQRGSAGKGNAS
jgi:hypothetical protein